MGPQIHKPGFMKQANKIHKHGSHRSKRSVENALRGSKYFLLRNSYLKINELIFF